MPYVTDAELVEIVPDLRAMAAAEASAEVRAALIRLAEPIRGDGESSHLGARRINPIYQIRIISAAAYVHMVAEVGHPARR